MQLFDLLLQRLDLVLMVELEAVEVVRVNFRQVVLEVVQLLLVQLVVLRDLDLEFLDLLPEDGALVLVVHLRLLVLLNQVLDFLRLQFDDVLELSDLAQLHLHLVLVVLFQVVDVFLVRPHDFALRHVVFLLVFDLELRHFHLQLLLIIDLSVDLVVADVFGLLQLRLEDRDLLLAVRDQVSVFLDLLLVEPDLLAVLLLHVLDLGVGLDRDLRLFVFALLDGADLRLVDDLAELLDLAVQVVDFKLVLGLQADYLVHLLLVLVFPDLALRVLLLGLLLDGFLFLQQLRVVLEHQLHLLFQVLRLFVFVVGDLQVRVGVVQGLLQILAPRSPEVHFVLVNCFDGRHLADLSALLLHGQGGGRVVCGLNDRLSIGRPRAGRALAALVLRLVVVEAHGKAVFWWKVCMKSQECWALEGLRFVLALLALLSWEVDSNRK